MFGGDGFFNPLDFPMIYMDPLAQSFMVDASSFDGETNGYLTSLDLFFSSKKHPPNIKKNPHQKNR